MCVLHTYIQIARDKTKNMFKEAVMQTGFGDQEDGDHPKLLFATKANSVFICNGLMAGDFFDQSCVISEDDPGKDYYKPAVQEFVRGNLLSHQRPNSNEYVVLETGDVIEIQSLSSDDEGATLAVICGFTSHDSLKASYMIHMCTVNPEPRPICASGVSFMRFLVTADSGLRLVPLSEIEMRKLSINFTVSGIGFN